jgi:hypothetical protein
MTSAAVMRSLTLSMHIIMLYGGLVSLPSWSTECMNAEMMAMHLPCTGGREGAE